MPPPQHHKGRRKTDRWTGRRWNEAFSSGWSLAVAAVVAALAFGTLDPMQFARWIEQHYHVEELSQVTTPLAAQYGGLATVPVCRVQWNDLVANGTTLFELFSGKLAEPLIIVGGPATLWPAKRWTPARLFKTPAVYPSVKTANVPRFRYWDSTKPMTDPTDLGWDDHINVSAEDLFGSMLPHITARDNSERFLYAFADLDLPEMRHLRRDVRPLAPLNIHPDTSDSEQRRFIWIGSENASTPFHYDTSHNLYFQVYGTKTFFLLPPREYTNVYVYPVSHPADRQVQVPWEPSDGWHVDAERFPLFFNVESVQVATLAPGEMLVLPAMWFHYVQASSLSISVNLWQLSSEAKTFATILADAVPLWQKSWPPDKTLVLLQHFLPSVIAKALYGTIDQCQEGTLGGTTCVDSLIRDLLEQHYEPLRLWTAHTHKFPCSTSVGKGLDVALADSVSDVAKKFRSMGIQYRRIFLAVWLMHLGDFAVSETGASPRDTARFLGSCVCTTCLDYGDEQL